MTVDQILYGFQPLDVEKKHKFCKFSLWTFTARDLFFVIIFYCSRKNSIEMEHFSHRN